LALALFYIKVVGPLLGVCVSFEPECNILVAAVGFQYFCVNYLELFNTLELCLTILKVQIPIFLCELFGIVQYVGIVFDNSESCEFSESVCDISSDWLYCVYNVQLLIAKCKVCITETSVHV